MDGCVAIPDAPGLGLALTGQGRSTPRIARRVTMRAHRDGFVVDL